MKYISLFSGIGGFEYAIHQIFPNATCLGYSDVKQKAIDVYKVHFPTHRALGDVSKISDEVLMELRREKIDLIVAGFPCTNLTSLATINGEYEGLEGSKSGLFFDLIRVIKKVNPKHIIIENNYSMAKKYRTRIDVALSEAMTPAVIHRGMLNAADFGVQCRKRIFWTTFEVHQPPQSGSERQTWADVLADKDDALQFALSDKMVACLNKPHNKTKKKQAMVMGGEDENRLRQATWTANANSRWGNSMISDTMDTQLWSPYPVGNSRPYISSNGGTNNVLIDRRFNGKLLVRHFSPAEAERLFHFPENYTLSARYKTTRINLLGNSVVVAVIKYILNFLPNARTYA